MKKTALLFASALVSSGLIAQTAFAADPVDPASGLPVYVSVFGGGSWLNELSTGITGAPGSELYFDLDPGYLFGGTVGVQATDIFRMEAELSVNSWKNETAGVRGGATFTTPANGRTTATNLMGNVWADFSNSSVVTPYVGGGVGISLLNGESSSGNKFIDDTALAFQLGAGVKAAVSDQVSMDLGYRLKGLSNFKDTSGLTEKYDT
jgi:opacity protein-like surface antigen